MSSVINNRYGNLIVLEELEPHVTPNGSHQRIVKVRCDCGNEYTVRLQSARKNGKCINCIRKEKRIDITGKRFGKLTVLSMADDYVSPSGYRLSRCKCKCDCGKECIVNMSALVTGTTRSCGCILNTQGLLKEKPELVEKYDFEKNEKEGIDFETLTARSSSKVWWKCKECGNSWFSTIASQNDKIKHGCPYCSGRLVIKGKTDLLSQNPDILKEWDYEKNQVSPDEISCHSSQKVWWKCSEGHSWKATVSNRVGGTGCPQCNIENVNSFCEQAVYYYIKKAFPDAVNSDKHLNMELDIFIPSKMVAIEYDGEAWHGSKKKTAIDEKKNNVCRDAGISLIRIREPRLEPISGCISIVRKDSTSEESLDKSIEDCLHYLGVNNIKVDTLADGGNIRSQYASKKYNNSLLHCNPDVAAEWHPTKNGDLTPDKVSKRSRVKVWWLGKCGHEWLMSVGERTASPRKSGKKMKNPEGCPYCAGKKILVGFNDLASDNPKILEEWNYEKNTIQPTQVTPHSKKIVWWKCPNGHEYEMAIGKRNQGDNSYGCPICALEKRGKPVINLDTKEVFKSAKEAGLSAGSSPSNISACCRGKQKTAAGYRWKYYEE